MQQELEIKHIAETQKRKLALSHYDPFGSKRIPKLLESQEPSIISKDESKDLISSHKSQMSVDGISLKQHGFQKNVQTSAQSPKAFSKESPYNKSKEEESSRRGLTISNNSGQRNSKDFSTMSSKFKQKSGSFKKVRSI